MGRGLARGAETRAAGPARLTERSFTVRLYFAEPEDLRPGQRVFSVKVQGKVVIKDLDVAQEAGGATGGLCGSLRACA